MTAFRLAPAVGTTGAGSLLPDIGPERSTSVALPLTVTVRRLLVKAGDRVVADQPVIELDQDEAYGDIARLRLDLARAGDLILQRERVLKALDESIQSLTDKLAERKAALATAQRNADQMPDRQWKDSPERAQLAYEQAVKYEQRIADLMARGAAGLQELEQAQVGMRVAAEDRTIARRFAEAQAEVSRFQLDVARLEAEVGRVQQEQARAGGELAAARWHQAQVESAIEAASKRPHDVNVLAPTDGVVAELAVSPGDRIPAGRPLFKLRTAGR